jgi:transcriptional regulator with XRE-family HTH domain
VPNSPDSARPYDFSVLRDLRLRADLTINQVSERSRVSAAVISKLERNLSTAELETLYRLARVFGLTCTDLVGLAESRSSQSAKATTYKSGDFQFERIDYEKARCLHARAEKGHMLNRPHVHNDDHEICWVLAGRLKIQLPHEMHILGDGEAVQFDAVQEHTYEALENTEFVLVHLRKDKRF